MFLFLIFVFVEITISVLAKRGDYFAQYFIAKEHMEPFVHSCIETFRIKHDNPDHIGQIVLPPKEVNDAKCALRQEFSDFRARPREPLPHGLRFSSNKLADNADQTTDKASVLYIVTKLNNDITALRRFQRTKKGLLKWTDFREKEEKEETEDTAELETAQRTVQDRAQNTVKDRVLDRVPETVETVQAVVDETEEDENLGELKMKLQQKANKQAKVEKPSPQKREKDQNTTKSLKTTQTEETMSPAVRKHFANATKPLVTAKETGKETAKEMEAKKKRTALNIIRQKSKISPALSKYLENEEEQKEEQGKQQVKQQVKEKVQEKAKETTIREKLEEATHTKEEVKEEVKEKVQTKEEVKEDVQPKEDKEVPPKEENKKEVTKETPEQPNVKKVKDKDKVKDNKVKDNKVKDRKRKAKIAKKSDADNLAMDIAAQLVANKVAIRTLPEDTVRLVCESSRKDVKEGVKEAVQEVVVESVATTEVMSEIASALASLNDSTNESSSSNLNSSSNASVVSPEVESGALDRPIDELENVDGSTSKATDNEAKTNKRKRRIVGDDEENANKKIGSKKQQAIKKKQRKRKIVEESSEESSESEEYKEESESEESDQESNEKSNEKNHEESDEESDESESEANEKGGKQQTQKTNEIRKESIVPRVACSRIVPYHFKFPSFTVQKWNKLPKSFQRETKHEDGRLFRFVGYAIIIYADEIKTTQYSYHVVALRATRDKTAFIGEFMKLQHNVFVPGFIGYEGSFETNVMNADMLRSVGMLEDGILSNAMLLSFFQNRWVQTLSDEFLQEKLKPILTPEQRGRVMSMRPPRN